MNITTQFFTALILIFFASNIYAQSETENDLMEDTFLQTELLLSQTIKSEDFSNYILAEFDIKPEVFCANNDHYIMKHLIPDLLDLAKEGTLASEDIMELMYEDLTTSNDHLRLEKTLRKERTDFEYQKFPGGPCENMDFETGDLHGWQMYVGEVNTNTAEMVNVTEITTPGVQHMIMEPGIDPVVGIPTTKPGDGQYSLRLGDSIAAGGYAASLRQTFQVSEDNSAFNYSYAVVMEDPSGHTLGEKPFFKVNVYDEAGNSIDCGEYLVISSGSLASQGWNSFSNAMGSGWYKDWETVFVPLQDYIGQDVTIELITGDCQQSGHFGYAYVDAECANNNLVEPGTLICQNQPITLTAPPGASAYEWSTGQTTQSIETSAEGLFTVEVVPVQGDGCSALMQAHLIEGPSSPHAAFVPSKTDVCVNETFQLMDSSYVIGISDIDYWRWDLDDSSDVQMDQNISYAYDSIGTYEVELSIELHFPELNGSCYDTTWKTIQVHDVPIAEFESTAECYGFDNEFTDLSTIPAGEIVQWDWDFTSDGANLDVTQHPVFEYNESGEFVATLIVTSEYGCTDTISNPVTVHPKPTANFGTEQGDVDIFQPTYDFVNESSLNTLNYWTFTDLGTSTEENPSFTFPDYDQGTYEVCLEVESDFGCLDSICKFVNVTGISTFFIPNSFTPNGDGINDMFWPQTFGIDTDEYEFKIFNRWGDKVFFTEDYQDKWNGGNEDHYSPDEVYTWQLKIKDKYTSEVFLKSGYVTVLR